MAEGEIVIKTVLDLSGSEQIIKRQVEKALNTREGAETRHQRRIEAITLQSANRIQQIEARKQAQIDAIRERGLQKELEHQRKIERETQRAAQAFGSMRAAIAGVAGIFTALAASGAVRFFEDLARKSIDAAIAIDRQVNTLKALTGSAEQARARFAELFALAQKTPGLTTSLASTLDVQLRILDVSEKTINRVLPVVGRLNAISPLGDPSRFAGNLVQLITQNFERQDLKELVGNSPFAGQLIKELFNVDSPTNAKAIRESARSLGINTIEEFFNALSETAENNPKLQAVTESLGTQFEKLQDRIQVAIAPIGDELLRTIIPAFRELVELLEQGAPKISALLRENRDELAAVASAFITVANAVGQVVGQFAKLGQQLGIIRLISLATVAITPGGASNFFPLLNAFEQADRRRASVAGRLPFGTSIEETIGAIRDPVTGRSGGGLGGAALGSEAGGEASRVAKERARELAEARKNSAKALDEFMKGNIEDLEQISKIINEANAQGEERRRQIEGRPAQLARFGAAQDERIRQIELESLRLEQNTAKEAARAQKEFNEELQRSAEIAREFDPAFRFMRGLAGETDATAGAFERLGASIGDAFGDLGNLIGSLGRAVKQFFNDLLSATLRTAASSILGPLFGGGGGGGLGNLFRTPSFAGGGGISAPPSVSGGILSSIFGGGGGGGIAGAVSGGGGLGDFIGAGVPRTAGSILSGGKFNFSGLGQSLGNAAPLLGLTIGAGLGGKSVGGNILGAAGGLLTSTFISTTLGAPGALGSLAPALFSNPITAIAGAGLLVGAVLLGKSKQRKQDEEASGQFLTQALQGIEELAAGVASGQIDGTQARTLFENQILGTFRQQISQLKTKSVVESRLKNQVNDLRKVFEARIPPLVAEQQAKQLRLSENADRFSRQVPEFATGGTTRGGLALLHPGEKVLNAQQQAAVIAQSNPRVFDRAGVPGPNRNRIFDIGGTMPLAQGGEQPIVIENLNVALVVGKDDQTRIVVNGLSTSRGRAAQVKNTNVARTDGDL